MLSERQREFATYLRQGLDAKKAAAKAGYSNPYVTANKLKNNPEILGYLSALQDQPVEMPKGIDPEVYKNPVLFLMAVMAGEIDASSSQIKAAIALLNNETRKATKVPTATHPLAMQYKRRAAPSLAGVN